MNNHQNLGYCQTNKRSWRIIWLSPMEGLLSLLTGRIFPSVFPFHRFFLPKGLVLGAWGVQNWSFPFPFWWFSLPRRVWVSVFCIPAEVCWMLHEKESNSNNIAIHNRKHNQQQQQQQQEEQEEEQKALKNALGRRCSCHALAFCGGDCIYPMLMEGSR